MEITIKNVSDFKKIFDAIKELDIVDTNLNFSPEELLLENMDSSHTSLVYLNLNKQFFDSYKCDKEIKLGINLLVLCKMLKACRENDILKIQKQSIESNSLDITIISKSRKLEYSIPEMDIEQLRLNIDDSIYVSQSFIEPEDFVKSINDISLVEGSYTGVSLSKTKLILESIGDLGKTKLEMTANPINQAKFKEKVSNQYSTNFIKKFIKTSQINKENMLIAMSDDNPIKLEKTIDSLSMIKFYIAPSQK